MWIGGLQCWGLHSGGSSLGLRIPHLELYLLALGVYALGLYTLGVYSLGPTKKNKILNCSDRTSFTIKGACRCIEQLVEAQWSSIARSVERLETSSLDT